MTNAELLAKIKAEIERISSRAMNEEGQDICEYLLSFLSALESEKPMDLEEELKKEIEKKYDQAKWGYVDGFGAVVMDKGQFIRIARHFAQWGAEHAREQMLKEAVECYYGYVNNCTKVFLPEETLKGVKEGYVRIVILKNDECSERQND